MYQLRKIQQLQMSIKRMLTDQRKKQVLQLYTMLSIAGSQEDQKEEIIMVSQGMVNRKIEIIMIELQEETTM